MDFHKNLPHSEFRNNYSISMRIDHVGEDDNSEENTSTSPNEKITNLIKINNESLSENGKYVNQNEIDKIIQLSCYKKDCEVKSDIQRIIDELYNSRTVNNSYIEQYSLHVNRLMNNKNQSLIIENLLENMTVLLNNEIEILKEKYFSNNVLIENFENLRKSCLESHEIGSKTLLNFINKFKHNLKTLLKHFEEIMNKLQKISTDIDRVFNTKKQFDFQIFINDELRIIIGNSYSDLGLLLNYVKMYVNSNHSNNSIFSKNEVDFIKYITECLESTREERSKISKKEEILTLIKLKNNQFSEVKDIDQIVKYIETSGADSKKKKNKKKSKKNKSKNVERMDETQSNDVITTEFEKNLRDGSKFSNEIKKIRPFYSTNFLTQLKELYESTKL